MTPLQQSALESLVGRALTTDEASALAAPVAAGNHVEIARPLSSIALVLRDVLRGAIPAIDLSPDTGNGQMLDAWVQAGALTTVQRDALLTLATHPDPITPSEVDRAMMGVV